MSTPPDPRDELARLGARIDALSALVGELLSRNEQARSRVEVMIQRLKSLEAKP